MNLKSFGEPIQKATNMQSTVVQGGTALGMDFKMQFYCVVSLIYNGG